MKLVFTKSFKKDYQNLPSTIQKRIDKQLEFLLEDFRYPSLSAKKIKGREEIWEARVTKGYHFTFQIEGDYYLLRRVGPHDILDNP